MATLVNKINTPFSLVGGSLGIIATFSFLPFLVQLRSRRKYEF